jgi:UDP-hydrolysing UDP-N-acetyl-D-glucosamine 2-epimerase
MVRIAVVVTARPSWTKLQTICEALRAMPDVELQIIACASALLERYGRVVDVITAQGFTIAAECWSTYEGSNLVTSAKETGALLQELAARFRDLRSDMVVVMADRHEVLAAAQAASYLHLGCVHVQAGERTGSIDDKVRDAITALSDYFFPCTTLSKFRVVSLTGAYDRVWAFGCSAVDLAKRARLEPLVTEDELGGAGAVIDLSTPFALVLQHPVTNEADAAHAQMWETLHALPNDLPAVCLWPGQDAGAEGTSKAIREYQELYGTLHTVRNLPPTRFLKLMTQCAVMVGNSSASVREGCFLGTPAVVVGNRQRGRQCGPNVIHAPHDAASIRVAIGRQLEHGRYKSDPTYGRGDAGQRIAEVLRGIAKGETPSVEPGMDQAQVRIRPRVQRAPQGGSERAEQGEIQE